MTPQSRERHKEYMRDWRRRKKDAARENLKGHLPVEGQGEPAGRPPSEAPAEGAKPFNPLAVHDEATERLKIAALSRLANERAEPQKPKRQMSAGERRSIERMIGHGPDPDPPPVNTGKKEAPEFEHARQVNEEMRLSFYENQKRKLKETLENQEKEQGQES